jgi:hypothetical protein
LQESKLELISNSVVCSLWGCNHLDWCYSTSRGASGGILRMWDRRVVEKIEECGGIFCCLLVQKCQKWVLLGFCGGL